MLRRIAFIILQQLKLTQFTVTDKFIEADIISNAILMFVSGSGTVCATLSFCFYELALNKHVQDKLRQEITSKKAKHGGQFNQDYVMDLQYTIMVLNGK